MVNEAGSNEKLAMVTFTSPDWVEGKLPAEVGLAFCPQADRSIPVSRIKDNFVFI